MKTIVLLFWFWIPWPTMDPISGYFELQFKTYNECQEVRDYLIGWVQTTYEPGSVANGVCYSKGTLFESAIDWKVFEDGLRMDLEAGRKEFEKQYGGDH